MFSKINHIPVLMCGVLLTICSLSGCSVHEDRDLCPCVLDLDLFWPAADDAITQSSHSESLNASAHEAVVRLSSSAGLQCLDTVRIARVERYRCEVSRRTHYVEVVSPGDAISAEGDVLSSADGVFPEVYTAFKKILAEGERVVDTVSIHKNHCVLSVKTIFPSSQSWYPFKMLMRGGVVGYNAHGEMVAGDFQREITPSKDGWSEVVLPRQRDSSLMLDIISRSGVLRSFALGQYLADSGYDWNALDLEDAVIEIDFSSTNAVIRISAWSKVVSFEELV